MLEPGIQSDVRTLALWKSGEVVRRLHLGGCYGIVRSRQAIDLAAGESEAAALIRNNDWSASSLGRIDDWPQSLRTMIDICLTHPLPCAVVCAPDRLLLYNDLCAHFAG